MNRALKIGIVGLLVVSVLAVGMAGTVLAQEETSPDTPRAFGFHGRGCGLGGGLCGQLGLEAAASASARCSADRKASASSGGGRSRSPVDRSTRRNWPSWARRRIPSASLVS